MAEMPELVELRPALEGLHVRLVAVSVDLALPNQVKTAEQLAAFAEKHGVALPILALRNDFDGFTARHDLPGGPPFTVLFDRNGMRKDYLEGAASRADIEDLIASARAPR